LDDAGRNSWGVLKSKAKNESLTPSRQKTLVRLKKTGTDQSVQLLARVEIESKER
jgi:hypothetical protein